MFNLFKKSKEATLLPPGTEDVIPLSSIRIPFNFKQTNPSHTKITRKLKEYNENNKILKSPIEVIPTYNKEGCICKYTLCDNYIGYIILLFNGVVNAPIKYNREYEI